tara:strand:+ start:331 stop:498 length:168 start_codon:yes stop_codon:yes gene_type:complete
LSFLLLSPRPKDGNDAIELAVEFEGEDEEDEDVEEEEGIMKSTAELIDLPIDLSE